jgi:c(7)-type cytochrome triheme protein
MRRSPRQLLVLAAALLGAASIAVAAELPRLPKDLALPKGEDSPGQVVFRHDSHVDAKKPSCTGCHPKLFPMLHESALAKGAITHDRMEKKGELCGTCHGKGKVAFDFNDDCENCHAK